MKYLIFALMAMMMLALNSCIDGEEEIVISADGSASMKVKYQVPGMIFSAEDLGGTAAVEPAVL